MIVWPESANDVPADLREYTTFADELAECNDFVFQGHTVLIPREYRQASLDHIQKNHLGINGCIRRAREAVLSWPHWWYQADGGCVHELPNISK
jgi:hypothetical protein